MIRSNGERYRRRNLHRSLKNLTQNREQISLFFFITHSEQLGRYKHESRALGDVFVGNFTMSDSYDPSPNYRHLAEIRFVKERCKNMKTFIFHGDGFFPNYTEISAKIENKPFMACLGKKEEDTLELRVKQPFTKNWWRFDQLPLDYQIPSFCDNLYGGVMDKMALDKLEKVMSFTSREAYSFQNGNIFFTGLMREKANIFLNDMTSLGFNLDDSLFLKERSFGDFTEDDVQKTFKNSFGKKSLERELQKIQTKMKEIK